MNTAKTNSNEYDHMDDGYYGSIEWMRDMEDAERRAEADRFFHEDEETEEEEEEDEDHKPLCSCWDCMSTMRPEDYTEWKR